LNQSFSPIAMKPLETKGVEPTLGRHGRSPCSQFHHQFWAPAPGGPRCPATRTRARWRGRRARRSAYRTSAPWHGKADRAQNVPAGAALLRPARLCRADEPGTRVLSSNRETAGHHRSQARSAYPGTLLRDWPLALAPSQRHNASDGCRRVDTAAVGLRGA